MNPRMLCLALLAAFAAPGFAQTALEPIAAKVRAQTLSFPAEMLVTSLTPAEAANPRQEYTVKRTFSASGTFTVDWRSTLFQSTQTFRADGTLLSSRVSDLAKGLVLEAKSDPGRTTLRTVVTENGKVKSDKQTGLKPGIALRDELQNLNLSAWACTGRWPTRRHCRTSTPTPPSSGQRWPRAGRTSWPT